MAACWIGDNVLVLLVSRLILSILSNLQLFQTIVSSQIVMRYTECFVLTSPLQTWLFGDHSSIRTRSSLFLFSIFIITLDEIIIIAKAGHLPILMISTREGWGTSLNLRAPDLYSMTEGLNSKMAVGIFCFNWDSACNLDSKDALTWIWPLKGKLVCIFQFPMWQTQK